MAPLVRLCENVVSYEDNVEDAYNKCLRNETFVSSCGKRRESSFSNGSRVKPSQRQYEYCYNTQGNEVVVVDLNPYGRSSQGSTDVVSVLVAPTRPAVAPEILCGSV